MDGRKIVLFPVIIDLDFNADISEIYKPSWSECFHKSKLLSEKNNNFIQIIEFGETFTIAGTDDGLLYSWGLNDFNQLGRKTDFDNDESSSVSVVFHEAEWKQPQKVY